MKKLNKAINIVVEKTETGFSAFVKEYSVFTTGENIAELIGNLVESVNLYLEDENKYITEENIKFELEFKQFFQHYRVLNGKYLAKRIGMNESLFSQYIKGKKKPSGKQVQKIINGIHEIGKELQELNLITK